MSNRVGFPQVADTDDTYIDCGPVRIGMQLPAVYREYDPYVMQFTAGLDTVLAPVWLAIDCFAAYLEPLISPADILEWLADWVGVVVDDNWRPDQLRNLIAHATDLYRWRGTTDGIADLVEAYTGIRPVVTDNGGIEISDEPGGKPPGSATPLVEVTLPNRTIDPESTERLWRLLRTALPAHIQLSFR
jgi:phage tail-like protein